MRLISESPMQREFAAAAKIQPFASVEPVKPIQTPAQFALRKFSPCLPRVLVIGASTGGPQALACILAEIAPHVSRIPVLVVLHLPPDFTKLVTSNIERVSKLPTFAAKHGEPALPGRIYFAPGDMHMRVLKIGDTPILCHADGPAENFCKPAADVLFRSAAQTFGVGVLGVVLTGMGADGTAGARAIVEAGGNIIAQDEASSVVWGMPGSVVNAGLAAAVLPLDRIGVSIAGLMRGVTPGVARC